MPLSTFDRSFLGENFTRQLEEAVGKDDFDVGFVVVGKNLVDSRLGLFQLLLVLHNHHIFIIRSLKKVRVSTFVT